MDRPFSTPGGGQVALLALSATLPRGTRLCFERRHSALLRRARRASEFYLLHRRGTRVFVFHCAHPRLPPAVAGPLPGRDDAPLVFFATLPRGTRLCFERRYSADLAVSKTRPRFSSQHRRGTRDLVTHSTTARLGSGDSPPALHATMLRLTPQRDFPRR